MITQPTTVNNETPTAEDYRILATELRDFLMTVTADKAYPDALAMVSHLGDLITNCTPDSDELLKAEYERVLSIMGMEGV